MIVLGALAGGAVVFLVVGSLPRSWTAEALLALDTQRVAIPELQGVLGGESPGDPMPVVRSEVQALRAPSLLRQAAGDSGVANLPAIAEAARTAGLPDALGERLSVFNDNRSLVISVAFTAPDPAAASRFVNALVDRYLADKSALRSEANRAGYAALVARANELRAEVTALEGQVAQARAEQDVVVTRAGSVQQQQLEDLSAALARVTAERAEAVAAWERARTAGSAADLSDVVNSETIARLREREAEAGRIAAEAARRYGPNHPDRRAAVAELAAVRGATGGEISRIVASLRARADSARARERALADRLTQVTTNAAGIAARQTDLQRLEREVEARRELLRNLNARVEQTGVEARATLPSGVRVLSRAETPVRPSGPKRGLATGFGLLAGAALGALLALLVGLRRRAAPARTAQAGRSLRGAPAEPMTPHLTAPAAPPEPELEAPRAPPRRAEPPPPRVPPPRSDSLPRFGQRRPAARSPAE
ncbi:GumC family protein [Pararoseomonas sp. SCSIO 73927]|uniref:GumC family protein n=1 Tax=Pararoseomonas sp. SCSIO 73927 TaxID=3114537 RepID=UPI0030CCB3B2